MTAAPQPNPRAKEVLARFEELRSKRSNFDGQAQLVCDVLAPNRHFTLQRQPGELRTRYLRDPTGLLSAKRLAAFLYGDMLSPATPWVEPYLIARDPTGEEARWFERAAVRMHARLSGPQSPIATQLYEAAQDIVSLGNNCTFRVRAPGQMPRVRSVPIADSFIDEDGDGDIDTNYYRFRYTCRQAARKYPECAAIQDKAEKSPGETLTFVQAVEPRAGGKRGAIGSRKPWTSTVVWLEGGLLVKDDQGYDRFPFQFGRFERNSGEIYGTGPGWHAYPAVWSSNAMAESILRAAELATDPPIYGNAAIFGGSFDRRPGAVNPIVDNLALYGQSMRDVIGKIDIGGDVNIGVSILEMQRALIERFFYIDWLWLSQNQMMTATEVNARRDMRMRMMAPVVARLEQEWLNPLVEEMFFAMLEGGYFDPPPQSLAGEEFGFRYLSPLALAQRGAVVDAIERTFQTAAVAHQFDQTAAMVIKSDELLRDAARLRGVPERSLRDVREIEIIRQNETRQREEMQAAAMAKEAAAALQAGAQGVATMRGAGQAQGELAMAA